MSAVHHVRHVQNFSRGGTTRMMHVDDCEVIFIYLFTCCTLGVVEEKKEKENRWCCFVPAPGRAGPCGPAQFIVLKKRQLQC